MLLAYKGLLKRLRPNLTVVVCQPWSPHHCPLLCASEGIRVACVSQRYFYSQIWTLLPIRLFPPCFLFSNDSRNLPLEFVLPLLKSSGVHYHEAAPLDPESRAKL